MKHILPVIFFCLSTFTLIAQQKEIPSIPFVLDNNGRIDCATPTPLPEIAQQQEKLMQQFIQRGTNLASPVAIPIKAHIVRLSNGTGGLSTDVLNAAIATMNVKYATLKMSFYLCGGIHYIDSDAFYYTDVAKENDLLVLNNVNDAINIYFVGNLVSGTSGLNGISAFPSDDPLDNRIIMWNNATSNGVTLAHEMGHYWNLYHTHETFLGKEYVNGTNCSTKGDLVCDTPADPASTYNSATCTYTGTVKDDNGAFYNPMVNNLMSYYGLCRDIFTAGQYTRMDAGYALRLGYTGPNSYTFACNALGAAPTNLALTQSDCSLTLKWNDNSNLDMGYIIESSTNPSGPFEAIGRVPANTSTYVDGRVLTTGVTYYYRVVAANSNATYSSIASKLVNWNTNCYCIPTTQSCGEGVQISNVTIRQGNTILLESISSCAATNGYSYPHAAVPNLPRGNTFSLSVSNPNYYLMGASAWIDFDHSGTFDADEIILIMSNSSWVTATINFTVPGDAVEGLTRMRVRGSYNSNVSGPCNNVNNYGETEDYIVFIGCNLSPVTTIGGNRCGTGTVNLTASGCAGGTINWYSSLTGGVSLSTGAAFTTPSLSATGTYYAGCTLASCVSTRTPVVATVVNPIVEENSAGRCGPGTLTLTATGCAEG
ncbi:MAG TPA: GEVED domain-containing protein, partial [Emticicia sp.]